jgi:hypothetical protein
MNDWMPMMLFILSVFEQMWEVLDFWNLFAIPIFIQMEVSIDKIILEKNEIISILKTGDNQPGCGIDATGSCSHSRAHALFAETIISNRFVAQRCNTLQQATSQTCTGARDVSMRGEPGNVGTRGIFHLRTNGFSPFAMG